MEKQLFKKLVINYLKLLTYIKLKTRFKGKIIALGGCFGKSSAVALLESVFSQEYKVYTTNKDGKGLNTETGIPFAILGIEPKGYGVLDWFKYAFKAIPGMFKNLNYDFLILEFGVDSPGDMKYLTSFIKPNTGIIINSNNTHSANFQQLHKATNKSYEELIAYENGFIFEDAKDAIIYNLDDPEVVRQIGRFKGSEKIPFSVANSPEVKKFNPTLNGTEIEFKYKDQTIGVNHDATLLDEYQSTIELIIKAADLYNLKPESLVIGISKYKLMPGRCSLFKGVNNSYILDSSYNSSYLPAAAAIKLTRKLVDSGVWNVDLPSTHHSPRTIAVLGDMRELGEISEKEHRKLAHIAAENLDLVVTVGPHMKKYFADEFDQIKKDSQEIYAFTETKEALEFISQNNFELIKENDIILVKASQNTLMLEIIVEKLLANSKDVEKLCRRGEFYDKKRMELLQ